MKNFLPYFLKNGVKIFYTMPENWIVLKNATTAPNGYVWICNGESRFGGKYKHALLKLNDNEN